MTTGDAVFLLWHGDDVEEEAPEPLLLGVYSSEAAAQDRIERARDLPGFRDQPESFLIVRYDVDKDEWPEDYVVVETPR